MSTLASLPQFMRDPVAKEFRAEKVLWAGRPSSSRTFAASMMIWLFAVPWTAFSLFWMAGASQGLISGKSSPTSLSWWMGLGFPLFGLPFVLVGLGMMALPFWAWLTANKTVYVISDRRFASLTVGRRFKVSSYSRASIVRTERVERSDGSGTLKVVTGVSLDSDGDRNEHTETLYGIADVAKVERLIAPFAQ